MEEADRAGVAPVLAADAELDSGASASRSTAIATSCPTPSSSIVGNGELVMIFSST